MMELSLSSFKQVMEGAGLFLQHFLSFAPRMSESADWDNGESLVVVVVVEMMERSSSFSVFSGSGKLVFALRPLIKMAA